MAKDILDMKDKKILTLLDENARFSNAQLARKVGLSKPAVEYRLKRFEKNDIIFSHFTVIDFTKLGYFPYKMYFKFQNTTLEDEKTIRDYWINSKSIAWVAQIRGRWDMAVTIYARSTYEFGQILNKFMEKHYNFILEKDVLLTEYSLAYSREYLEKTQAKEFIYGVPRKITDLDDTDIRILKELSNNARIPIIDLADKTKLTRDIINYRIKKLTKDGIIIQYRTFPNMENIGINYYKVLFKTKNFNEKQESKLREYVGSHKRITQFLKLIGSWDLEIEFETRSENELYELLTKMRKEFSDIIRDFDILRIMKTYRYSYFPF